jgi:hypothetical protein
MPPVNYITAADLRSAAEQQEASGTDAWEALATAISRMFDRECEIADEFFGKAAAAGSARSFLGAGTEYVKLSPYIPASITEITVDDDDVPLGDTDHYSESEQYLVFKYSITKNADVSVTARWGFPEVPADIRQACIEQALFQWRRKDLAFAELAGVASAAVAASFSPTFQAAIDRYRGIYSRNNYFA